MSQYHYSKCGPCDKCEEVASLIETDWGEMWCENCLQSAAEAAYERMCEDFHDGGNTSFPDGERKRMEEARKLK